MGIWCVVDDQVGDFAMAIDKVFESLDAITMDSFFQVIMHWTGVNDQSDDVRRSSTTDRLSAGDGGSKAATERGEDEGDHGSLEEETAHSTEHDSINEADFARDGGEKDDDTAPSSQRPIGNLAQLNSVSFKDLTTNTLHQDDHKEDPHPLAKGLCGSLVTW